LTKLYGQIVGLNDVSFTVKQGEIFGFLGPNGAGKTTTIRLLLNLLHPTSGNMYIFDQDVKISSFNIRQKCGYLPGDFFTYGNMTATEFLTYVTHLRNSKTTQLSVLIERFGFQQSLSQKIKHLSHGTRQKLGILQTFLHEPDLVILDEPTTGLDPLVREQFYQFLREYQAAGKTIFFSSHNLPEVEKVCDRIAIIRQGELVALEHLETLKKKRFRRLELELQHPIIDELTIPGVQLLKKEGLHYEFLIHGDLNLLFKKLATLPLSEITFPEPTLEEVFLLYYKDEEDV
jgi:ABC-2 type transport system ATP-binding protein